MSEESNVGEQNDITFYIDEHEFVYHTCLQGDTTWIEHDTVHDVIKWANGLARGEAR